MVETVLKFIWLILQVTLGLFAIGVLYLFGKYIYHVYILGENIFR